MLADDLHHFPAYDAVYLYRADLARRAPRVVEALRRLEGRVTEAEMVRLNARTKIDQTPSDRVAADFLGEKLGLDVGGRHRRPCRARSWPARSSTCGW